MWNNDSQKGRDTGEIRNAQEGDLFKGEVPQDNRSEGGGGQITHIERTFSAAIGGFGLFSRGGGGGVWGGGGGGWGGGGGGGCLSPTEGGEKAAMLDI